MPRTETRNREKTSNYGFVFSWFRACFIRNPRWEERCYSARLNGWRRMMRRVLLAAAACVAVFGLTVDLRSQTGTGKTGEWRDYAGDKGFTKYSPVDQINAS